MTICMVGDVDQVLYRFNGAYPEIMTKEISRYYPDIETIFLETNYRSTRQIVATCQRLIAHNYSDLGGPYEQRFMKSLQARPDAPEGEPVTFQMYETPEHEAQSVVASVLEQIQLGYVPGDFFIGARTRSQLAFLEGQLSRAKIPYINIAGGSFWTLKHVADVIAYLRLAVDHDNKDAFRRVYNIASDENVMAFGPSKGEYCSHRYLGGEFLKACGETYRGINKALRTDNGWRWQSGAEDLNSMVYRVATALARYGVAEAVHQIVKVYTRYLKAEEGITAEDESENGKLTDLDMIIGIAGDFDSPEDFLAYVDEMVEASEAAKNKDLKDYLVISTIHRLKGLERAVTFGIGFSEGFMKMRDTTVEAGLLPHTYSMTLPPQIGVLPTGGMGSVADECCVAFVLVSRAKDKCFLSGVVSYGKIIDMRPSRFVQWMELKVEQE